MLDVTKKMGPYILFTDEIAAPSALTFLGMTALDLLLLQYSIRLILGIN